MGGIIRLDKYLSDLGIGSRKDVKQDIRKGKVRVNDKVIDNAKFKVNTDLDKVYYNDQVLEYKQYIYIMLNKPAGVVSATKDNLDTTVIDLIKEKYKKDIFPVGRLDKDTEGLLLITNDGQLAHNLLSPKKKIGKTYYALVEGRLTKKEIKFFNKGIKVDKDFKALPAELEIIESGPISKVNLTIYEGKFHQVKRMFKALGMEVVYLKRISMGSLKLDENLDLGEYRYLTKEEVTMLKE